MVLVPGKTEGARLEELRSLVPHHVLYGPDCSGLGRLLLVPEQGVGPLHAGRYLGVGGSLVDGRHEVLGVEAGPVQHDGVPPDLGPHHVRLLVIAERYPHDGSGVVESLLETQQTAVSHEDLEVRVGQEVLLGDPGLEDHVTGQVRHLLPVPLPDDRVAQLGEGLEEHLHPLLSHLTRLDGGPEGDVDHSLWMTVHDLLEMKGERPTFPAVNTSDLQSVGSQD